MNNIETKKKDVDTNTNEYLQNTLYNTPKSPSPTIDENAEECAEYRGG